MAHASLKVLAFNCALKRARDEEKSHPVHLLGMVGDSLPAIGIVEEDRERESSDMHVVNNWCLLGTAKSEGEVGELLVVHHIPPGFSVNPSRRRMRARRQATPCWRRSS